MRGFRQAQPSNCAISKYTIEDKKLRGYNIDIELYSREASGIHVISKVTDRAEEKSYYITRTDNERLHDSTEIVQDIEPILRNRLTKLCLHIGQPKPYDSHSIFSCTSHSFDVSTEPLD